MSDKSKETPKKKKSRPEIELMAFSNGEKRVFRGETYQKAVAAASKGTPHGKPLSVMCYASNTFTPTKK